VVNDLPPKDRDIAMVFQNYALYPHMTVEQNLAFGLQLRKTPKDEIKRRVARPPRCSAWSPYLKRKPARCPAASGSGSRWAGPSSASRRPS
jgi:multiple sugar transport system ATP-binding protein